MKLTLTKETVRSLAVRTSVRTGLGGTIFGPVKVTLPDTDQPTLIICTGAGEGGAISAGSGGGCGKTGTSIIIDPAPAQGFAKSG